MNARRALACSGLALAIVLVTGCAHFASSDTRRKHSAMAWSTNVDWPFSLGVDRGDGTLDVKVLQERLRMPLVHDEVHGLYALGPESGGQTLTTARAPDLTLPQLDGSEFSLSSMRGRKIVMVAWASW